MSPEAIQSLIEMFGVEKGVQILNLFTVQPEEGKQLPSHRREFVRSRRRGSPRAPVRESVSL